MSGFTEMKTKKFAFFGCWNEVHYPSEDPKENDAPCFKIQENESKHKCDEFSTVLEEIKRQPDIDFLIVAGDNYYPQKKTDETETTVKKTKTFIPEDFKKGFNALKSIDKPTYLLLGNHDVDNIVPKEKPKKDKSKTKTKPKKGGNTEEEKKTQSKVKDCSIIEAEVNSVKDSNIKMFDYKTELIVKEMQKTNTLCIMVDTSIFIESLDCYAPLLNESDKYMDKDQIIDKQKEMIENIIQDHRDQNEKPITKVCFFGHHPLLCLKKKENNPTIILEDTNMEWNRFLFRVIFENDLQEIPHIYYFCADLHQYQEGIVTIHDNNGNRIEIEQYIAGTGGAYMDPKIVPEQITPDQITKKHLQEVFIKEKDSESEGNIIHSSYEMTKSIKVNGFLIIHDNPKKSSLTIDFYPVFLFHTKIKTLSHLPSLKSRIRSISRSRSRSSRRSHYLSRRGNKQIKESNSLGGKTKRIKRKCKKNKY